MDTRLPTDETRSERVFPPSIKIPHLRKSWVKNLLKEFLKPTFGKVVILLVLSLLQVVPFYISFNCDCPTGLVCAPCPPSQTQFFSVYKTIYLLILSFWLSWTNVLSLVVAIAVIYLIACLVVFQFRRFKQKKAHRWF